MKKITVGFILTALLPMALLVGCAGKSSTPSSPSGSSGPTAVSMGTAGTYAVLAYSGITGAGPAPISVCGNVGIFPNDQTGITGTFAQYTGCTGVTFTGPAAGPASTAQGDLTTAYDDAAARTGATTLATGVDVGGETFTPGLYKAPSSLSLSTGTVLTLDAKNVPNAVFIFQIVSSLTANGNSQVHLINGAQASNVYWQVGSSCTLDGGVEFAGTIMANDSITFDTGATLAGQALAIGASHGSDGIVSFASNNVITQP